MAIKSACTHCGHVYTLADEFLGKKVRCKQCQEPFTAQVMTATAVPQPVAVPVLEALDEEPVETPVRAARRRDSFEDEADQPEDRKPRRPKRKRKSSEIPVGLIIGVIVLGFFVLGGVVAGAILFTRTAATPAPQANQTSQSPAANNQQSTPQGTQQTASAPAQGTQQAATSSAASTGWDVTLSNAKFVQGIPHPRFIVEYRFNRGQATPGTSYYLVIDTDQGLVGRLDIGWREFSSDMGKLDFQVLGPGFHGPRAPQGPFILYLESGFPGGLGTRKRISNSVRTDGKEVTNQPPPPANNAAQNSGSQAANPANPPPKVERKPLTDAEITKALEDIKSGDRNRISIGSGRLSTAPDGEIPASRAGEIAKAAEPYLTDSDMFIRQSAASLLEKYATADQAPALIKALDDSHFPVRHAAIRALGRLKEQRAAEPLAKLFSSLGERHMVVEALKKIGGPGAEKAMVNALKEKDLFVRMEAARVLQEIGTKTSLPALEAAAANDENFGVKSAAGDAVRAIKARSR